MAYLYIILALLLDAASGSREAAMLETLDWTGLSDTLGLVGSSADDFELITLNAISNNNEAVFNLSLAAFALWPGSENLVDAPVWNRRIAEAGAYDRGLGELCSLLVMEKHAPQSYFGVYIRSLPNPVHLANMPILYNAAELKVLELAPLAYAEYLRQVQRLERAWAWATANKVFVGLSIPEETLKADFRWAFAISESRGFSTNINGVDMTMLLPIADAANQCIDPGVEAKAVIVTSSSFGLFAQRAALDAGATLCVAYTHARARGEPDVADYLLAHYGYLPADKDPLLWSSITLLSISVTPDDDTNSKLSALRKAGVHDDSIVMQDTGSWSLALGAGAAARARALRQLRIVMFPAARAAAIPTERLALGLPLELGAELALLRTVTKMVSVRVSSLEAQRTAVLCSAEIQARNAANLARLLGGEINTLRELGEAARDDWVMLLHMPDDGEKVLARLMLECNSAESVDASSCAAR